MYIYDQTEEGKKKLKQLEQSTLEDKSDYLDHVVSIIKEFISLRSSDNDYQNDSGISQMVVEHLFGGGLNYEDKIFHNKDSALSLLDLLSNESVRSLISANELDEAIKFLTRTVQFSNSIEDFEPYKAMLDMSFINLSGLDNLFLVVRMEGDYLIKIQVVKYEKQLNREFSLA